MPFPNAKLEGKSKIIRRPMSATRRDNSRVIPGTHFSKKKRTINNIAVNPFLNNMDMPYYTSSKHQMNKNEGFRMPSSKFNIVSFQVKYY